MSLKKGRNLPFRQIEGDIEENAKMVWMEFLRDRLETTQNV
jgi:hypothetical protein